MTWRSSKLGSCRFGMSAASQGRRLTGTRKARLDFTRRLSATCLTRAAHCRCVQAYPLRVGLVGIGVGARQLLPALASGAHARLVAVADLRPAALEHVAQQ